MVESQTLTQKVQILDPLLMGKGSIGFRSDASHLMKTQCADQGPQESSFFYTVWN